MNEEVCVRVQDKSMRGTSEERIRGNRERKTGKVKVGKGGRGKRQIDGQRVAEKM
jgi:hypothetical protein